MNDSVYLDADDPAPVEVFSAASDSPFVIVCDHAGHALPRHLGSLGLSEAELASHIAWDIGAAGVARQLCSKLGASLILQRYSRLVIDCNRPLDAHDSIPALTCRVPVPGNDAISSAEAQARVASIFQPYHDAIRRLLDARTRPFVLIALHTFTPELFGFKRPWHAGVLYERDTRLAAPLLSLLRAEPDLVVGDNEPYAASAHSDYSIIEHAERRGAPYVELEVRQDLVADAVGQALWAERLARLLRKAHEDLA